MIPCSLQASESSFNGSRWNGVDLMPQSPSFEREHVEAVVMLAGDDDVFHPGIFRDAHPFLCVELDGVELLSEFFVLRHGHVRLFQKPFGIVRFAVPLAGGHRIDAPVNEHPEASLAEPFHPLAFLRGRFGGRLGFGFAGAEKANVAASNAAVIRFEIRERFIVWPPRVNR